MHYNLAGFLFFSSVRMCFFVYHFIKNNIFMAMHFIKRAKRLVNNKSAISTRKERM